MKKFTTLEAGSDVWKEADTDRIGIILSHNKQLSVEYIESPIVDVVGESTFKWKNIKYITETRNINRSPFEFPENAHEANEVWKAVVRRVALASRVLCVARTRVEGAWGAYIDAVPGKNHDEEFSSVLCQGTKMLEPIARAVFPCFDGIPYAR